jgi:hypothetical protein
MSVLLFSGETSLEPTTTSLKDRANTRVRHYKFRNQ